MEEIRGTINIYEGRLGRYRNLKSSSKWFNESDHFDIQDQGSGLLIIKKCYLEIPKSAQKCTKGGSFSFLSELPLGTFDIDEEESTEDELIIYY